MPYCLSSSLNLAAAQALADNTMQINAADNTVRQNLFLLPDRTSLPPPPHTHTHTHTQ